jgi:3-methyl-2-oxobutanoate hydroxymethyltransferase
MKRISGIQDKKTRGEKIVMLTAYDAWMARLLTADGGVDILLVGDSVGMVELGYETTLPVTMSDMVRHTRAVRAGAPDGLIVADMPFLSHQIGIEQGMRNAGRLMQQGGASAVKLEGGGPAAATVERIVSAGIPVMGHLGLLPQSVHLQSGFRRQATDAEGQRQLVTDALALESAGAFAIVIECVPNAVACEVTGRLRIPVIGIGSGPDCDGQVLVTHDILGLSGAAKPPFAKQYADVGQAIEDAVKSFSGEVRSGAFPHA